MALYRNFFNVGAMTLVSRMLGFVRDMLIAQVLGTGAAADAFFAAFRFPNLFRRLFAEGAFNSAFIPLFSGALEQQGDEPAKKLAAQIISMLALVLLVVTILVELFAPIVMVPFVPGFLNDPEKFDLMVLLTRICFPYLACMSLMAAYGAILNSLGKFIAAAFAPVLLNIVLVALLIVLVLAVNDAEAASIYLSFGVLVGGIAQLGLLAFAVDYMGHLPKPVWPQFDRTMRRFWTLAVPAILTGGVTQINIFVGTIIASGAASAISYLYYADRLYQLPLGIIGIAIGVVLLPELSRHLKAGRDSEATKALDESLLFALVLSIPATVALMILSEPIIQVLFERGAFDATATRQTATALVAFAAGLPAFVAIKVFQPPFFAREDTRTPALIAALSVAINITLSLILFPALEHLGIAIATSVAAWINTMCLLVILMRRNHYLVQARHASIYGRVALAALGMGALLFVADRLILSQWASGFWGNLIALSLLVLVGLITYFGFLHITRVFRLGQIFTMVRKRRVDG